MNSKDRRGSTRARMADVARLAGVSTMTVSRTFREPERVASETRERVAAAVAETGYVPDLVAGALASRRSGLIAAAVSTLSSSIFADTIQGLSDVLRERGYALLLGNTGYSEEEEEALIAATLGRRPDGLVLTSALHTDVARKMLHHADIPVVETWEIPRDPVDMAVGFSNFEAARTMTISLAGAGYQHIAFIGGTTPGDLRGQQRREGYVAAMRELDRPDLVIGSDRLHLTLAPGAEAVQRLADLDTEVDAILCVSDMSAVGAVMECHRRGWQIPERLAVAGFGDFEIAAQVVPGLTTVRIPGYEMGRRAAEMLTDRLAGRASNTPLVDLGFEIVQRDSALTVRPPES